MNKLRNMLPSLAPKHLAHHLPMNAIFMRELSVCCSADCVLAPDYCNQFLSKLCSRIACSSLWSRQRGVMASLSHHIERVILYCSLPQMRRIDTGPVVAGMHDNQSSRGGKSTREFVSKTMGKDIPVASSSFMKNAITDAICCAKPVPALIRMTRAKVTAKTDFQRGAISWHPAIISGVQ